MHQNKPTAPITYLNIKGKNIPAPDDSQDHPLMLNIKELAIIQTLLNRSYFNCNCNLNKLVIAEVLCKIKANIKLYEEKINDKDSIS